MMQSVRTTCPYCGVGCGLVAQQLGDKLNLIPDADHPANFGRICSKGAALAETLTLETRLLNPQVHGRPATWEDALDFVAKSFLRIIAEHGPDAVAFYVSGQLLTEDYYVANKLMKGFIGSGNIDTNSRLCMSSAVAAHKRAFGEDIVPGNYEDIELSDLTVLVGSNMAWTHPVLFQRLVASKEANPKKRIVVIDPRRTVTAEVADLHLALLPGTDGYLFNGLLNHLRREDALDWEYLEKYTEGFASALQNVKDGTGSVPQVASLCGLEPEKVAQFYRWFAQTPKTTSLFSQGINQSSSGVDKGNAIINVHLATGRVGKPGASPISLTGQPNAMGGREVGGLANTLAAHLDFTPENCAFVGKFWNSSRVATKPGLKAVELFDAMSAGRVKAVWIMGTNPVVSMPNSAFIRAALTKCEMVVVSDCESHTDTTACADVLFPAAAWGEKSGTVTNSERRISRQRAFISLPGLARPDWWIICEIAKKMGFGDAFQYTTESRIFREHAALSTGSTHGQRIFNIGAFQHISDQQYQELAPVQWPVPSEPAQGTARLFAAGGYATAGRKAQWISILPRVPASVSTPEYPFILNTGRMRDQWHTMTRTSKADQLMQHASEPLLYLQPLDAQRIGVVNGELVRVSSQHGMFLARASLTEDVGRGQIFMPMHWNAQFATHGGVNSVVAAIVDPISGQPEFKAMATDVTPYRAQWHAVFFTTMAYALAKPEYCVRVPGRGVTRYEMADCQSALDWRGWFDLAAPGCEEIIEYGDMGAGVLRLGGILDGKLHSLLFVSSKPVTADRAWLASLFVATPLSSRDRSAILSGRPPAGSAESGTLVCACMGVRSTTLKNAILNLGANTLRDLQQITQAGTHCGSCIPELKTLLAQPKIGEGATY